MKANHNALLVVLELLLVVLYNTKILKMKANHNKEKDFQENVFHMPEWRVHLPSSSADGCRMIYKYNT